jgi:hypothetical protein
MQLGYSASFFLTTIYRLLQGKPRGLPTCFIQSKSSWTKTVDAGAALDIGMKE